jgi:hypothetical protein
VAGLWFSPGTLLSSTNKTDCHDITEILLKVALNTPKKPPIESVVITVKVMSLILANAEVY